MARDDLPPHPADNRPVTTRSLRVALVMTGKVIAATLKVRDARIKKLEKAVASLTKAIEAKREKR
jgi:hypothetical protein